MTLIENYHQPIVLGGSFTWAEFTLMKGFKTYAGPNEEQYNRALFLFQQLQPLRDLLGLPLIITSGVRTPEYTAHLRRKGISAAIKSAHLDWCAVDLVCPSRSSKWLWDFFDVHWLGRMEHWRDTPTWVHLDTRNWGRRQRFRA
jgi:uncharacterized protein YcbK (DUF882 family)